MPKDPQPLSSQSSIPDPPPKIERQSVSPEELLAQSVARAGQATLDSAPPVTSKPQTPDKDGAVVMRDGRPLYRYEVDGNVFLLPKPLEEMGEEDFYKAFSGTFDPSTQKPPQDLTVVFKDAHMAGHWFNKSAKEGQRVAYGRSLGFEPAKKEDLKVYARGLNDADGAVESGDLILMKVHKAVLYKRFADYLGMARAKGGVQGYKNEAQTMLSPRLAEYQPFYHTPHVAQETINQGKPNEGLGPPSAGFPGGQ